MDYGSATTAAHLNNNPVTRIKVKLGTNATNVVEILSNRTTVDRVMD